MSDSPEQPSRELVPRLEDTRRLLAAKKRAVANDLLNQEHVPAGEIAGIARLEVALHGIDQYERLREFTREPDRQD